MNECYVITVATINTTYYFSQGLISTYHFHLKTQ